MATWLEKQREKVKREAENKRLTKLAVGLDTPSGNPFGRWAQGVAQRTLHPLEALASVAQQSLDDPMGTALNWSSPMSAPLSGLVGMFAGKGAKTANLAELMRAEKLAKAGVPDAQIWKKTGWTLDTPDKLPRFEIPDNAAKFTKRGMQDLDAFGVRMQSGIFEHPELYAAHPDVGDISTMRSGQRDYSGVYYNDPMPRIELGLPNKKPDLETGKSINLHELQHAIQQREGFARGGSPEMFNRDSVHWLEGQGIKQHNALERAKKLGGIDPESGLSADVLQKNVDDLWVKYNEAKTRKPIDTHEQYQRLAGEAEARLTQARMNMTPEQRLAQYPYQPEYFRDATGVNLNDLIVHKDGGTAMSVPYEEKQKIISSIKQYAESFGMRVSIEDHSKTAHQSDSVYATIRRNIPVEVVNKLSDAEYMRLGIQPNADGYEAISRMRISGHPTPSKYGYTNAFDGRWGSVTENQVMDHIGEFNKANILAGGVAGAVGLSSLSDLLYQQEYQ